MAIPDAIFESIDKLLIEATRARLEHRFGDAKRDLTEAVKSCRKSRDQRRLARSLAALGQIQHDLHNDAVALHLYEEAGETYRKLNDPLKLARTVRHVGDILRHMNRFAAAHVSYAEAVGIYRTEKEPPLLDLANALRGFALLKEAVRENAEAKALWQEAGNLYAEVNVAAGIVESARRVAKLGREADQNNAKP